MTRESEQILPPEDNAVQVKDNQLRVEFHVFLIGRRRKVLGETIFNLGISVFNLVCSISRRSLSPVIRRFASAARQHSRTVLSSLSLQRNNFVFGTTTFALTTNAAIPERRDLNWASVILPSTLSSTGVSLYSLRSWGETHISALEKAFFVYLFRNTSKDKGRYEPPRIDNYPICVYFRRLFSLFS